MSVNLKRRLKRLEEDYWRKTLEATDQYLHGRSMEDVEFFCAHGYLPEIHIPGPPYEPTPLSWEERWAEFRKVQRMFAHRTDDESEYFCAHGHWPQPVKCVKGQER